MLFNSFGLSDELQRAVHDQGYTTSTPVQAQSIPAILKGKDVLAGAQTGTGKTAGFALPIIQLLENNPKDSPIRQVRCLILVPTRELALQVSQSVKTYGKYTSIKSTEVYGGVSFNTQAKILAQGVDILIATPGRLLDHIEQKTLDLSSVEIFVLDEADRMLDMGFIRDIRRISQYLPKKRQTLLFSATFSNEMKSLANSLLTNPEEIQVTPVNSMAADVKHIVHPVDHSKKFELLVELIQTNDWNQILIFIGMKHSAERLTQKLNKAGIHTTSIHGDKTQAQRTKALDNFKKNKVKVLVGTDVASRGLDIQQLPVVINYELPNEAENYIHRIGRTGRAGNTGTAISLVAFDESNFLKEIEYLLDLEIEKVIVPGFEPDPAITHRHVAKKSGSANTWGNPGKRNSSRGRGGNHRRSSSHA
jgi:ATP-dependent RNA helicase RhlE